MKLEEVRWTELSFNELYMISLYTDLYFPRSAIDHRPSQFHYDQETRNPNWTGIVGEWGVLKAQGFTGLGRYLINRPYKKADRGDVQGIAGIFDIKTNVWKVPPAGMWRKPYFCGNVEDKHLKKDFLAGFIFTVFVPEEGKVYIMGYKLRRDFIQESTFQPIGTEKENGFKAHSNLYDLHYQHLRPIGELGELTPVKD